LEAGAEISALPVIMMGPFNYPAYARFRAAMSKLTEEEFLHRDDLRFALGKGRAIVAQRGGADPGSLAIHRSSVS